MAEFESKRDTWLMLILGGSIVIDIAVAVFLVRAEMPLLPKTLTIIVLLASAMLILSIMRGTRYVVDREYLVACCGPFRWRVPLAEIRSIDPTRSPLSSPALSLDRLKISYGDGKALLVSPADKARFRNALGRPGR